jgi:signal recognition particle GTPase
MNDFREQLCVLHEIGPLHAEVERADIVCISAIVASMTDDERRHPERFLEDPGRVARGSGREKNEIADLLDRFATMRRMMRQIGRSEGLIGELPGFN